MGAAWHTASLVPQVVPTQRTELNVSANGAAATSGPGDLFGRLVRLNFGGTPSVDFLADFVAAEGLLNPDGIFPGSDINSNPYSLIALSGGGFGVVDAGANALWNVGSNLSTVTSSAVFAPQTNPFSTRSFLPMGDLPFRQFLHPSP
jgi:hypothetical protein